MFVETKTDGEAQQIGRDDFIAWLRTKPPAEQYDFMNLRGECAVGQYMAARGVRWEADNYLGTVRAVCGMENEFHPYQTPLMSGPETFGALLQRMIVLRAAS